MLKLLRKFTPVFSNKESQLKAVPWSSNQRWHSAVPEDTRPDILPQRSQKWPQWLHNTEAQTTITIRATTGYHHFAISTFEPFLVLFCAHSTSLEMSLKTLIHYHMILQVQTSMQFNKLLKICILNPIF